MTRPPTWNEGKGAGHRFLVDHVDHHGDECVLWPFSHARGYGHFSHLGKRGYVHRTMCEMKKGPAPSDVHQAAHSCGNSLCVNPNHIGWKTPSENMLDCRGHGTHVRNTDGPGGRITSEQAAEIRALKGVKTLDEIAIEYSVSVGTISKIWVGKTHSRPRILIVWSAEEDAVIRDGVNRGLSWAQMANSLPRRTRMGVAGRAHRLGISISPAVRKAET